MTRWTHVMMTTAAGLIMGCHQPKAAAAEPADPRPVQALAVAEENEALSGAPQARPEDSPEPKRLLRPEDLKGLAWRSVGPANMGGRVAAIAVAPGNPRTFFIGYGTGGLFKTTNGGTTFTPVFDKEGTASIGAVAVADAPPDWPGWVDEAAVGTAGEESDPATKGKAKIVWVGTGEGNGRNSSSWGDGVYRSIDGGATFKNVGLRETHDIPRLAVDPRNPDVCYVAAMGHLWGPNLGRGLYKTSDAGKTWQAILQVDELTGCCDVVLDPQTPDTVYAAMYTRLRQAHSFQSGGPNGGIFRSDDGGATFKKLTTGLPPETGRIGLDVVLKDPRIIHASVESDAGGRTMDAWHNYSKAGGVFRSEDRGETWARMSILTPRAFYFSRIRVDPKNDHRVYLPGWGLGVSDDGG